MLTKSLNRETITLHYTALDHGTSLMKLHVDARINSIDVPVN